MTTISDFKSQMQFGGARPNQFKTILTIPGLDPRTVSFLCKAAQLPASTIDDITAFYRGRPVHFAGERTFQPWNVTIYNDNDFVVRNALEQWSNDILNYNATNGLIRPVDYQQGFMQVHQLDRNDNVMKVYEFIDVYPTVISAIALDYDSNNQIETFDVEFTFNYFTTTYASMIS